MDNETYFSLPHLSQSSLSKLRTALIDCRGDTEQGFALFLKRKKEDVATSRMDFGTALHCLILEPERFKKEYTFYTGKSNSKVNEAFFAECEKNNMVVMTETDYQKLFIAEKSLYDNSKIAEILNDRFLTIEQFYDFDYLDVKFKMKIDITDFTSRTIYDLKTTKSVNPRSLKYSIKDYGYDIQNFIYRKGIELLFGKNFQFKFIFVENNGKYNSRLANLSEYWFEDLEEEIIGLVNIYKQYNGKDIIYNGLPEIVI